MSSIALVDCNNFFVSCERLFNPKLHKKPVAVLSSNDGCIVARSSEVKAMGVPMGAPYFQWADFLQRQHVFICSSNFELYADLSHRVMETLNHFNPEIEPYSIDEAFLYLNGISNPLDHCRMVRQKVLQWTGIPVSIGIASTKTLAKVANHAAKKREDLKGVSFPSHALLNQWLDGLDTIQIWGIGSRIARRLAQKGVFTAGQFRDQSDFWIKDHFGVIGLRTAWELRGIPCFEPETASAKQSIMTSRSFGKPVVSQNDLIEAICSFGAQAGKKLREEKRLASWLQVFIVVRHNPCYSHYAHIPLPQPTNFTPTLLEYATEGIKAIFRNGLTYKKAGILLGGLVSHSQIQQNLFIKQEAEKDKKREAVMELMDQMNLKFGYKVVQFASEGIDPSWKRKQEMCSSCFTTRWPDIPTIQI